MCVSALALEVVRGEVLTIEEDAT
ncbi:uncharacterized protein G2W53_012327 [Senna tora]|uniref:Uncharacterized protein n=1 Tax=Senna tora TaxID=362788 RepID=A0A834U3T3_9FABA|nr:uncharacterized protein G2W53_012327 [Senna tora]